MQSYALGINLPILLCYVENLNASIRFSAILKSTPAPTKVVCTLYASSVFGCICVFLKFPIMTLEVGVI